MTRLQKQIVPNSYSLPSCLGYGYSGRDKEGTLVEGRRALGRREGRQGNLYK